LWTQDPKGVMPRVYAIRETTVNATTLSKARRYEDQRSRDWQSAGRTRVEHSPHRKRRQTSIIEMAKDGMSLKANTRRGRTTSPPGTRHLRTLTQENSGGSSTTACMKQETGQQKGWATEGVRGFLDDRSHYTGKARTWECLPVVIRTHAINRYRKSTKRPSARPREFNKPFASHLAKWGDMYIAISECRRREAFLA
jgi:hypothetical protein